MLGKEGFKEGGKESRTVDQHCCLEKIKYFWGRKGKSGAADLLRRIK